MKKLIISTLLYTLPIAVLAQSKTFTVKITLSNAKADEKAYLRYNANGVNVTDSATLADGNFMFKGAIKEVGKGLLVLAHNGEGVKALAQQKRPDGVLLYLEQGDILVKGTDSVYNAAISGTISNIEADALKKQFYAQTNQDDARKLLGAFIKSHPASWVSLDVFQSYGGETPDVTELEPLFNNFSDELKNSTPGKYYSAYNAQLKSISIGAIAPPFTQNDRFGKPVSLQSFKGKYVLVDFWASWCGPCRMENPNVVAAYKKFSTKNFTVLGVSLDTPQQKDAWLAAITKDGLLWTQVADMANENNPVAILYAVNSIPQNFLLDPTGKIIAKNLRGPELEAKLTQILGAPKPPVKATAKGVMKRARKSN